MSGHTKWSKLRDELVARPGAAEALERARAESDKEIELHESRRAETSTERKSPSG